MDSDSIRTPKTSHSHNIQVTKVYSKGSVKIGIVGAIGNFKELLSFNEVVCQFKYQSNGVFGLLDIYIPMTQTILALIRGWRL